MAAPTISEIFDTLIDYADFEEVGSVERARTFASAAKRYLLAVPQSQGDQGSSMSMSVQQIENILSRALKYIANSVATTSASSGSVSFLGVGAGFRS